MAATPFEDPICRHLYIERVKAGRSQASVAADIGVSQSAVSEWETGAVAPTLHSVQKWAEALGFTATLVPAGGERLKPEGGDRT